MLKNAAFACLILGFGFSATGCIKTIDPALMQSPAFDEGYADGCATAHERQNGYGSPIIRNEAQFETDESYQLGWKQGYGACGGTIVNPRDYNEDQWYHQD